MITRDWFIRHEVFIIAARHWFPATDMKIASLINHPDRKRTCCNSANAEWINVRRLIGAEQYVAIYEKSRTPSSSSRRTELYTFRNFFLFREKYNYALCHKNNLQHSNASSNLFNKPTALDTLATNCYNWHLVPSRIKAN